MTVQRLINKLQNVEDKSKNVEVAVRTYTQRYPVAYCEIYENNYPHLQEVSSDVRIEIHLPSDNKTYMLTSIRKIK